MNKIDVWIHETKHSYDAPSCWDELTQEQFVSFVGNQRRERLLSGKILQVLTEMEDAVAECLMPTDWHALAGTFEWLYDLTGIQRQFVEQVIMGDGATCYGYAGDFDDVTWEEWMYCDTFASRKQWAVVAAVLYRPGKKEWSGEDDRRISFSKYGVSERLPLFEQLSAETLSAIEVNYLLLRQKMTDKYKHIFYEDEYDEEDEETKKKSSEEKQPADWVTVIRNMMGDNFFEQDKYLRLPVNAVLFQLDRMVKERNERKRHGGR